MSWLIRKDQKGFTLIELLLALAILGVVTYFIVSLTSSVRQGGKAAETSQRMEIISAKMKEYYRAQEEMPEPAGDDNEVPVDALNLEAKFRFDGFGQVIYYHRGDEINGVEVDGVENMAGYLWSLGGDQAINAVDEDPSGSGTTPGPLDPDDLADTAYSVGDDILMAINVNREAMEIALDEVRELQRRVNQYDNLFTGEDACVELLPTTLSCPPTYNDPGKTNDPNCGTATLDQIEESGSSSGTDYDCGGTDENFGRGDDFIVDARTFIVAYYGLADDYLLDPWGNPYQWGCGSICADTYHTFDPRYRKFFSMGPDGENHTMCLDSSVSGCSAPPEEDDGPGSNPYDDYDDFSQFRIKDDIIP